MQRSSKCTHPDNVSKRHMTMLELRPNCELCDRDLSPRSNDAFICTFECTFCADCAKNVLGFECPNCKGNLVERPLRPESLLTLYPASTKRVLAEGRQASETARLRRHVYMAIRDSGCGH